MARLKDTSVEAVKSAADIVAVVEARVRLRKSGGRYMGLCPFHQEKTPSFHVNPARNWFHCFGCHESGDVIDFVEKTEQLDFVGAIEWLADRFGVALEYEEISPEAVERRKRTERLYAVLERAAGFYERYLWETDAGAETRAYLESRGLGEAVCRGYRLGLAPRAPTLARRALAEGYTTDELLAAGLANRRGNDYFSGRLLFPLADARGRVRGFQARRLHDDDPLRAKYVNSPEGELFRKGDILYGLDRARPAIAKQDRAVVVEGNTDVLALRQAGFEPVVASMGTALTERQLKELGRLTRRLFLCFDADAAGQDATLRGMELARRDGFDVRIVALEVGKDPADDPAGFTARLGEAEPYVLYRVRTEILTASDRNAAYVRAQEFLNGIPDSPERREAWRIANDKLGVTVQLRSVVSATSVGSVAASPKLLEAGENLERSALAGVAANPTVARVLAELGPEHFDSELHRRARAHLLGEAPADDELLRLMGDLDARAHREALDAETTKQLLLRLRERRLQRQLAEADEDRLVSLQQALLEVRDAIREFA
jgi:DNA primase